MLVKTWKNSNTSQKFFVLLGLGLLVRVIFSVYVGLIDDEAFHWSWSKELALSYFDHPGMVAWMEALSTWMFGDVEWAVRLPSFLAYCGTMYFAGRLAWELFDEYAAYFVVALMMLTPLWGLGGYVASPEPFFMFFWTLAAWIFWQSCREDERRWPVKKTWLWLGVVMGLGLNSKFIMAMLAPGFGIYLLTTKTRRRELLQAWPWLGIAIATLVCLPIFVWNYQTGWPGFIYQFHDRHAGQGFSAGRWLGWWGAQIFFFTPFVYALMVLAFARSIAEMKKDARWRFLFALSVPSFFVFYIQPFFAEYKPHWAGPAYLIIALGAAALWSQGWATEERVIVKPFSRVWTIGVFGFLLFINVLVYSTFPYPWLPKVHHFLEARGAVHTPWQTTWDFSNEFFGWKALGADVNRLQREHHAAEGKRPFIAALRYETTGQTYWGTKQKTYYLSHAHAHYTVIQNQTNDLENLVGQDALVVTTEKYPDDPRDAAKFDSCTENRTRTFRFGEPSRVFTVWFCKNFQGLK